MKSPKRWQDYQQGLNARDIAERMTIQRADYAAWERRDRIKRELVLTGLVLGVALVSGVLGYLIGAGF